MQRKIMSPSSQTHKHNYLAYQSIPEVHKSLGFIQQEKSTGQKNLRFSLDSRSSLLTATNEFKLSLSLDHATIGASQMAALPPGFPHSSLFLHSPRSFSKKTKRIMSYSL